MSITRSIYLALAIFSRVMASYLKLQSIAEPGGQFDMAAFIAAGATTAAALRKRMNWRTSGNATHASAAEL